MSIISDNDPEAELHPIKPKALEYYIKADDSAPFIEWLEVQSNAAQGRIRGRLIRVANGNPGKARNIGDGVHELKFRDKGFPTYRIYFGNDRDSIVIILLGGDKSTQSDDIKLAKEYWDDYQKNK